MARRVLGKCRGDSSSSGRRWVTRPRTRRNWHWTADSRRVLGKCRGDSSSSGRRWVTRPLTRRNWHWSADSRRVFSRRLVSRPLPRCRRYRSCPTVRRMIKRSWPISGPLDVPLTLRFALPATSAAARLSSHTGLYALGTAGGPAVVTITWGDGKLEASAVGSGATQALEAVPRTVGLDDEPAAFPAPSGPLRELHRRHLGLRLGSTGRVFDSLLPTILGQRVTTDEAKRSYRQLVSRLGEPAPGETGLRLPPTPATVRTMSYEQLHPFGIERSRAEIVIETARRASRLEEITAMSSEDAVRRLSAVRGIGTWTTGYVMGSAWGDTDAIPRGDLHLPNLVSWMLAGEPRGNDDRMEELLEPFRPFRRRALILLKLSGAHAPRYGPRSPKSAIGRD